MFQIACKWDSFCPKLDFVARLFSLGLLRKTCPTCKHECDVECGNDRNVPRIWCCMCKKRFSATTGTVFDIHKISNIPLFVFVAQCFVLRMTSKQICELTGSKDETVAKYLDVIKTSACKMFQRQIDGGFMMLGGPGKSVEIDECKICQTKYNRGKVEAKEGVWVVGITEVDEPKKVVSTPLKMRILEREDSRKRYCESRTTKGAKRRALPEASSTALTTDKPTQDVDRVDDVPVDDEIGPLTIVVPRETSQDGEDDSKDFEEDLRRLFSQSRLGKSKPTVFFIVKDRSKATLHSIIQRHVIPGTTIYSDEWRGYWGIEALGYRHQTICHKKRFSRFEADGDLVERITTNHIERMWVGLRQTVKFMSLDKFRQFVNLEPYRLTFLYCEREKENVERLLIDAGTFGVN